MKQILLALIFIAGLSSALAQAPDPAAQNALITQANAALAARNWQEAERLLKQLDAMAPNQWAFLQGLGDAQGGLGRYQEAVASYDKAIALAEKNPPEADGAHARAALGTMWMAKGNMLLKLKKNPEAIAAYNKAAPLSASPAVAYFNICAVLYNLGQTKDAVPACDKAIAADPTKADAYFIKGSALFGEATIDGKGKMIFPPAALPALRKYLALAPNGGHAADVKEMLKAAGDTGAPRK